jgi:hypothetical protein
MHVCTLNYSNLQRVISTFAIFNGLTKRQVVMVSIGFVRLQSGSKVLEFLDGECQCLVKRCILCRRDVH